MAIAEPEDLLAREPHRRQVSVGQDLLEQE